MGVVHTLPVEPRFPAFSTAVGGPLVVLFLAHHSAAVRTMDRLKRYSPWRRFWGLPDGGIAPREFHDEYLRQLERFWALDESGLLIFGLEDAGLGELLWEHFVLARALYRLTNCGVLIDRDTRA